MSLWWCPTCQTLQPNGTYMCPVCGTGLVFGQPETEDEKQVREQAEMIEESLRMNG